MDIHADFNPSRTKIEKLEVVLAGVARWVGGWKNYPDRLKSYFGSGPDWGRIPVERGEIPSVRLSLGPPQASLAGPLASLAGPLASLAGPQAPLTGP